jgi:hypothetical protein
VVVEPDPATSERLRSLAADYAAAVDERDADGLRRLFTDDATLTVRDLVTGQEHTHVGAEAIGGIAHLLATRYPATFHLLGQSRYRLLDERSATGEVRCQAHHHVGALGDDAVDRVMLIRYVDEYRAIDGEWRIAARTVEVRFVTEVPIPARATVAPAERGR